jgi:prevent-host-death family protein
MKTATLRQLRNETNTLIKWVEAGETVVVTKRSKPILRLLPVAPSESESCRIPDFEARQYEIFPEGRLPVPGHALVVKTGGFCPN